MQLVGHGGTTLNDFNKRVPVPEVELAYFLHVPIEVSLDWVGFG